VAQPWGAVDLRDPARGRLLPWRPTPADARPQDIADQKEWRGRSRPNAATQAPGQALIYLFDARDPRDFCADFSRVVGPAAMPPRWALGYQQSHRTIRDPAEMLGVIDGFRERRIPLDAVIYLGTGFSPRGWNTPQPSLAWNPDLLGGLAPEELVARIHGRQAKVVLHVMPPGRDVLPTLRGTIPPAPGEVVDGGHVATAWAAHVPLVRQGVDAFWPDEGDWLNLPERLARYRMYSQGLLASRPGIRPWSLVRNGHPGMAQWGAWMWSGDVSSTWHSLEAQIAVGLNAGISLTPYWGSDIGGFIVTPELTGELYARWIQFAAFTPSFRGHGQAWRLRLPWGWEAPDFSGEVPRHAPEASLANPAITAIAKAAIELRYRLLPYHYTLAWEARARGLPLMRPLWLHHPEDPASRACVDTYTWGRDLLVAPVYLPGAVAREVPLPPGRWYDWWTGVPVEGGRTIRRPVDLATLPLYARAGAIIPLDPVRQYTAEPVDEPTTLRIYTGADGAFTLYEDDGASLDYQAGQASGLALRWRDGDRRLSLAPSADPALAQPPRPRRLRVHLLPDGAERTVDYPGGTVEIAF
jgi:alpha-glucosidase (family GH31 glycosyl hydrolase)